MSIQSENRRAAYYDVKPDIPTRRWYIAQVIRSHPDGITAEEILEELLADGIISQYDPNFCRPRLTELTKEGVIEAAEKRKSLRTGKSVTVWKLKEKPPMGEQTR